MVRRTAAIAILAVSNNTLAANITMALVARIGVLVINLTSANTASRHNYLRNFYISIIS